jgi:site-specific DNA-methyltransferase (adenine-specific)
MFARYLISLTLSSMHIVKDNFRFVPVQDFNIEWDDKMLFDKYGLDQEEIEHIESMIRPMELPDA